MTIDAINYSQLQRLQKEEQKVNFKTSVLSIRIVRPAIFKISNILRRRKLNTNFFHAMNKSLAIVESQTQDMVDNLSSTLEVSEDLYDKLLFVMNKYQATFNKLEKANFIRNRKTEELFNRVIDNLYLIESDYREKAFSNKPKLDDNELVQFISHISKKNIEAYVE